MIEAAPAAWEHRVESAMRRARGSSTHGDAAFLAVEPLAGEVRNALDNGPTTTALAMVQMLLDAVIPEYDWLEGETDVADWLGYEVVPVLEEATRRAGLSAADWAEVQSRVANW